MTGSGYRRKDIKRACDCCGAVWFMSEMRYVGQNRWFCPDDAPGLTAEQISRHNARVRPLIVNQARHPRPRSEQSDYLLSEAAIFRAIVDNAGVNDIIDQNGARTQAALTSTSIGLAGLYLSDVINDGRRVQWISAARTKMIALADLALSRQVGGATTGMTYGAVQDPGGTTQSVPTALAGRLFLRAYALTGSAAYLTAADSCGHFLRRMQRTDATTVYSVADDGTTPQRVNGFCASIAVATGTPSTTFGQDQSVAIDFFNDLRSVRGGSTLYGDAAASIQASIDSIIADAIGFYFDGAFRGTPLFSTTTPYASFTTKLSDGSGTNAFGNFSGLAGVQYNLSQSIAFGLRALFGVEGYSARVASFMAWLQSFTGYDTTLAPARFLAVQTKTAAALSATNIASYGLSAAGRLAPVVIAGGGSIAALKDALAIKRTMTAATTDSSGVRKNGVGFPFASVYAGPTGVLGFDMTAQFSTINIPDAAALGEIYRLLPRAQDSYPDGYAEVA